MPFFKKAPMSLVGGEVLTIIGPEAFFHGSVTVRGSVRVEGEMEGNITEAIEVVIGRGGKVRGDVCADRLEVAGEVRGDVVCSSYLEIKAGGKVIGNIRAPKLLMEDGAVFEGHCAMSEAPAPAARRAAEPQSA